MPSDKTLNVKAGSLDATSMRYHELWLQRWLYSKFFVREGYPVPVVFATPMDAFSHFSKLWADENNPFAYLFALKDDKGTPLYEPHPSPVRYPLISVSRKGLKFRTYQNFSIHQWRHINWPTVSDAGPVVPGKEQIGTDLVKCDLGNVTTSKMPMAWDYRYQIDHFCLRPDTQAFYLQRLMSQFWRSGGGVLQTWIEIEYPGWGSQYIRAYVDGEIDQSSPEDADLMEKNVEYRTSFTLVIEGFLVDLEYQIKPTLWKLIGSSASPEQLTQLLATTFTTDLRTKGYNEVLESRVDVPSAGTCQTEGNRRQWRESGTVYIRLGDLEGTWPGDNVYDPNHDTPDKVTDPIIITPAYSYGIPSTLVFGTPIFMTGTQEPHWLSGMVSPTAQDVGIVVPGVGTFYTASNGSYFGLLPFNYSGTAVPHYAQASEFIPPVRVYKNVTEDMPNQNYSWLSSHHDPWVSGTVTPGTAGVAIEFPDVGTFYTNSAGSYTGTLPFGYSGIATPRYWGADSFTPPVRVYAGLSADIDHQNYSFTPVIHYRGTDYFSQVVDFGNIPEYHIWNFVNEGNLAASFFGTHFEATVPATSGTECPVLNLSVFGTHSEATVFFDGGTDSQAVSAAAFGTYTQTVTVFDGGTYYTNFGVGFFGTATQVIVATSARTDNFGHVDVSFFGTYQLE